MILSNKSLERRCIEDIFGSRTGCWRGRILTPRLPNLWSDVISVEPQICNIGYFLWLYFFKKGNPYDNEEYLYVYLLYLVLAVTMAMQAELLAF